MKTPCALLLLFLGSCASTTSLSLYVGERSLEDSDIEEVDEQTNIALEFLWGILPWGLGLEVGLGVSEDDATVQAFGESIDIDSGIAEVYIGARKTFREEDRFRPYIGAGLAFMASVFEIEGETFDFDDDDTTEALYARAGLGWHFAIFHVGVDYRLTTLGEGEFAEEEVDLDSGTLSIFGGLSF